MIGSNYASLVKKWLLRDYISKSVNVSRLRPTLIKYLVQCGLRRHFHRDEPLAYIMGTQPFMLHGLEFMVRPPVLIPRVETESWATFLCNILIENNKKIIEGQKSRIMIIDLCSGSGCISLGIATSLLLKQKKYQFSSIHVLGIDISEIAIRLSKDNESIVVREFLEKNKVIDHRNILFVEFIKGDLRDHAQIVELLKEYHSKYSKHNTTTILVCNPPYIPTLLIRELDKSVRNWEDHEALDGQNEHGTMFYELILREILPRLPFISLTALEMYGKSQISILNELVQNIEPRFSCTFHTDFQGNTRLCIIK